MPYVLLLAEAPDALELRQHLHVIGPKIAVATARALPPLPKEQVSVMVFPYIAGYQTPRLLVWPVGQHENQREGRLNIWKQCLFQAAKDLEGDTQLPVTVRSIFASHDVHLFPTLPIGAFGYMATMLVEEHREDN